MKKLYVIGSSSELARSVEKLSSKNNYTPVFYGRSNPFKLDNFTKYEGIDSEESVEALRSLIFEDLENTKDLKEVGLIILAGVSSIAWRESYLLNEYMPAVLSYEFAEKVLSMDISDCSIVLVSSSAAYQGAKLPYATTKASLTGILHTISKDYKNSLRINMVLPSAFDSGMISDWDDDKKSIVAANNYIGRLGTADDIADAILFTINNKFITNSIVNMTGGTVHI